MSEASAARVAAALPAFLFTNADIEARAGRKTAQRCAASETFSSVSPALMLALMGTATIASLFLCFRFWLFGAFGVLSASAVERT